MLSCPPVYAAHAPIGDVAPDRVSCGFSARESPASDAVMTAFMQRPGRFTALESYRAGVLPGVSFGAMLLALVPLVPFEFDVAATTIVVGYVINTGRRRQTH
jgi:hypothetical protein